MPDRALPLAYSALIELVSGSAGHDPFMALPRDSSKKLEVGVVVQHGQVPRLCRCADQSVHKREGPVLATGR